MSEEQEQPQAPAGYIRFAHQGSNQWSVDSNVQNWEWHILQIAAAIKKSL